MLSSSIWHQNNLICSVEFWQQIMAELPVEFSTGSKGKDWFITPDAKIPPTKALNTYSLILHTMML
jgi:hypothetical protein